MLKITGFLMLVVFIIATLAFTSHKSKNVTCQNIEVKYTDEEGITLSADEIIKLTHESTENLFGKKLSDLDTESIEISIEKHNAILNAEVYTLVAKDSIEFTGILGVKIKHRDPVMRIITSSNNYYLDKFAGKIPVSNKYTANVLVVTGDINEQYAKEKLLPLALYIIEDEFWKSQIEQIHIEKNGNILISPLVGNLIIELGLVDNYWIKLRNMKAFYEQILAKNNWNTYNRISVKYNNQIVAKKR